VTSLETMLSRCAAGKDTNICLIALEN